MIRYMMASWAGGILFWVMDGLINGNPYAISLYKVYQSNLKAAVNIPQSFVIYLIYGFVMAGMFLTLYKSLPGRNGIVKGLSFAAFAWFFRGFISVMSQWMLYAIPFKTLFYISATGLAEALILGIVFGLVLKQEPQK